MLLQVFIPVLIIAGVSFWGGVRWERERRDAELAKKPIDRIDVRR